MIVQTANNRYSKNLRNDEPKVKVLPIPVGNCHLALTPEGKRRKPIIFILRFHRNIQLIIFIIFIMHFLSLYMSELSTSSLQKPYFYRVTLDHTCSFYKVWIYLAATAYIREE